MLYGAKVLGSYVGSEESIANRLEKKLAELKKEADAITMVGSLQIQYLFFLTSTVAELITFNNYHTIYTIYTIT